MTVQTETSRSGPYAGAGITGPFTVGFRFLSSSHLRVIRTSVLGVDATLVLDTDYTASGVGASSGTVTLTIALAVGEKLTIIRDVPFTQTADYVTGDSFPAESHEDALDLLTMQAQQLKDDIGRSLTLPATSVGASTELPSAAANSLIGWDETGGGLKNVPVSSLATSIVANTWRVDKFNGTGAQTVFVLSSPPGNTNAVLCSVSGVVQTPGINFSITDALLTFLTGAPAIGINNVVAQFGQSVSTGSPPDLSDVLGVLAVDSGGTGSTNAAAALAALGAAASGANTDINSLANLTTPLSIAQGGSGSSSGFASTPTNKVINGNFGINQRAVSGTVVLAAGIYGHDRFKAGAAGCTYTFATALNVTTITISAGSLIQVVEGLNLQSGAVVLSWTGTSTGKIDAGSFSASGVTGTAIGGTNMTLEFSTGTLSLVQLETGAVASAFEQRLYGHELVLCQRYHYTAPISRVSHVMTVSAAGWDLSTVFTFPVRMRVAPTITAPTWTLATSGTPAFFSITTDSTRVGAGSTAAGSTQFANSSAFSVTAEL